MRKSLILATVGAVAALSSCTSISDTAYTTVPETMVVNMTVADIDVSPEQVTATTKWNWNPFRTIKDHKSNADAKALRESGADVLIEPTYEVEKRGLFRGGSVTVTGHPGKFVNFRNMSEKDAELIATLKGNLGVATPMISTTAPSLVDKLRPKKEPKAPKPKKEKAGPQKEAFGVNDSDIPKAYNRVTLSYECEPLKGDGEDYETRDFPGSLNGFGLGYTHGFRLKQNLPLYLELGGKFSFLYGSTDLEDYSDGKSKLYLITLNVPVSVTYRYSFGDGIYVAPYLGLNFNGNLFSEMHKDHWSYYEDYDENPAKKLQIGWQLGASLYYKKLYVGLGGGTYFNNFATYCKSNHFNVSIGLNF